MFGVKVIDEPADEPIRLDEAKLQLNVADEVTHHDSLILGLITAARVYCETVTGKAFITRKLRLTRDTFPGCKEQFVIRLPRPPLYSITPDVGNTDLGIEYDDTNGDAQALDDATYVVDSDCEPGRIGLVSGQRWPLTINQLGCVRVTYLAGYGTDPGDVPQTAKLAMLMLISHWFENREAVGNVGGPVALSVGALLSAESAGNLAGTFG